jgi:POT family proton-dependent oligopeptide transporter
MNMEKKGHPRALYTLFATEMWERFSYYGMRALLTLYLTAELVNGGFGLEREAALKIYAVFTGLVYLTPILGGWIADKFLGKRKTVYIGGLVMAVGQFLLASSSFLGTSLDAETRLVLFNFGLGVLIIGNGFFKPNISTIVGDFYDDNDPRKDSAFNIFYMGINLGAILGPFIAGALGENVFWGYGYLAAGIGMLLGVTWMYFHETTLEDKGLPPNYKNGNVLGVKDWKDIVLYAIGLILATFIIMWIWRVLPVNVTDILTIIGFAAIFIGLAYIIFKGTEGAHEWSRMIVILVLAFFNIAFWAGFEQAGGTFNLFAKENTNRQLSGFSLPDFFTNIEIKWWGILAIISLLIWVYTIYIGIYSDNKAKLASMKKIGKYTLISTLAFAVFAIISYLSAGPVIPASWFQNVNPIAILIFAPIFSVMWLKLDAMKFNPRTPVKFALGLFLGALAFWIMTFAANKAQGGTLVSPMWLVVVYTILTLGELMLSPIGLSMITKLAPTKLGSVVMGLWMASFAAGNYLAGVLESILHKLNDSGYDLELYPFIMWVMLISGAIVLAVSPLLNKAMKGIH